MDRVSVARAEIEATALAALVAHGATGANAGPVARALALAEAEGNPVCGLFYLPHFCAHLRLGKVDGRAVPQVQTAGQVVGVDAAAGFAHPAFEAGLPALAEGARRGGIACMTIARSYNALALGHFVRPLAERGLIGIAMSNAPASVSPPGGRVRLFGTNPLAFAVPLAGAVPLVVDQSLSAVTKTAVLMRQAAGEALEPGWGQDAEGRPTLDPAAALAGSLLPAGGQKGANIALLVEVLAAALTGANPSTAASPLGTAEGGPPGLGQFVVALDPAWFSPRFPLGMKTLARQFAAAGLRPPGARHRLADTVDLPAPLWRQVCHLAAGPDIR